MSCAQGADPCSHATPAYPFRESARREERQAWPNRFRPEAEGVVFAASLRAESVNGKLAAVAARVAERLDATVDHASMHDFDVPLYDGDIETNNGIPDGAQELRRRLLASDAFIISSPEYNASMPGIIKNLIDWTSRFRPQPFDGRHGLLLSASPSLAGRQPGPVGAAHAARAPRRAHLPRHVFAGGGAQGNCRAITSPTRLSAAASRPTSRPSCPWPKPPNTTRASSAHGSSSSANRPPPAPTASDPVPS